MVLNLIKKDILIAKNLFWAIMILVIAIPLFFMLAAPASISSFAFLYMVILSEVILAQSISSIEAQSPKAPALLCTAPYTRKSLVSAKYIFFILLFAFCYAVHTLLSFIINPSFILDVTSFLTVLLCGVIIYGIYMPIEFKYGNVKARFVFMVIILLFSVGPPLFTNFFADIDFSGLIGHISSIPVIAKCFALGLSSAILFFVSMGVSVRIFANKEL